MIGTMGGVGENGSYLNMGITGVWGVRLGHWEFAVGIFIESTTNREALETDSTLHCIRTLVPRIILGMEENTSR